MPPKKQKGGKGKGNDDWDDDAAEKKLAALKLKEEDVKETVFSEDEEEEEAPVKKPMNRMAAFQMLDDDDDSAAESSKEDDEPVAKESPKKEAAPVPAEKKDKKKKKGKKEDKKKDEEDELEALLENIEKKEEKVGKKAKKKEKKEAEAAADEGEGVKGETVEGGEEKAETAEGGEDEGKKKKKKKKKGGKEKSETPEDEEEGEKEKEEEEPSEKKADDEEGGEEEDGKKKKKKDKKKKEDKKDDKKDGKKKKHVDMIKEFMRAKQEAEEAQAKKNKEEEERLEAVMKAKEEEERIAKEKKEREKQRKKEREEQLKKEGKFMSAKEKERMRITQAKLAAANIQLPVKTEEEEEKPKKRILYGARPKKGKGKQEESKEASPSEQKSESPEAKVEEKEPSPVEEKEAEVEVKEEEEPLEDWEMAEEQEVKKSEPVLAAPTPAVAAAPAAAAPSKPVAGDESEESSSEEESDSDEEESDEEESESDEDESEDEDEKGGKKKETKEEIRARVVDRIKKRREIAMANRSTGNLRAPVICVLGHVDTGKTKMLDTIRRTNVQDGEAGGITQQIGATQVPIEAVNERCKMVRDFDAAKMKLPGFLIIDTPGHESFANLRSRGSSLCDYAILVVDIMHGLEQQTIESLKLLIKRGTPFVIALNKIDRLYGYESNPRKDVYQHLKSQPQNTQLEFQERYNKIVGEFAEQGLNVVLSNKNRNEEEYYSMVPTSAFMGDGVGNIMAYIAMTTQTRFAEKLAFCEELDATVMEVKAIAGLGTTIDVILVNGTLRVNDVIVITGTDGAIITPIKELLMPQPLKELRVKNEYGRYKEVKAAQGIKIITRNPLEKALAGLPLFVARNVDEVDILKEEAEKQLSKALMAIKKKPEGVYVQASTLGSLEALLEFLKTQKIPYSNVNIGPVHKRDVQKASVMLEHNPEFACILAFDVKVEKDAQQFADHEGVRIFQADIIYHLEDNFLKYREELRAKARKENEHLAIFPCKLRVLPQHVFNARNPIVVGVQIEAGQLKRGTPLCVPSKEGIFLGAVSSIEKNHDQVELAKAGDEVCIKIENTTGEAPKLYGRHFTHEDPLVSRINRESIDVCKEHFRDDLTKADWQLIVQLKKLLDIM